MQYVLTKRKWVNYVADCLYAPATGRIYADDKGVATLPRWHEIAAPKMIEHKTIITKDDVRAQFLRLKGV